MKKDIPPIIRTRMSKYFKICCTLREQGIERVRSQQIVQELRNEEEICDSTVRRDLSYLGTFGRQGFGYEIDVLLEMLAKEIGIGHLEEILLVGVGHMGQSLLKYNSFKNKIGQITLAFDLNRTPMRIENVPVYHIDMLPYLHKPHYQIAIIAVPGAVAQEIAEKLVVLGIRVIINYSSGNISIKNKKVKVQNIDLDSFIQEAVYSCLRQR